MPYQNVSALDEFVSKKKDITVKTPLHTFNLQQAREYLNSLGTCERFYISNADDLERLANYYLVWYTENTYGESGWDKANSVNYTVSNFVNDFKNKKLGKSYKTR